LFSSPKAAHAPKVSAVSKTAKIKIRGERTFPYNNNFLFTFLFFYLQEWTFTFFSPFSTSHHNRRSYSFYRLDSFENEGGFEQIIVEGMNF